jgi:hypothetical protein
LSIEKTEPCNKADQCANPACIHKTEHRLTVSCQEYCKKSNCPAMQRSWSAVVRGKDLSHDGTPHEPTDRELKAMTAIVAELRRATAMNGPFHSAHEGYGVMKEEFDELWDEIKRKAIDRDPAKMQKEAIQLGAMAMRFIIDVCMSENLNGSNGSNGLNSLNGSNSDPPEASP